MAAAPSHSEAGPAGSGRVAAGPPWGLRRGGARWPTLLGVTVWEWGADWHDARRSGRLGLPDPDHEDLALPPRVGEIRRGLDDTVAVERLWAISDTSHLEAADARFQERMSQLQAAVAVEEAEIARSRPPRRIACRPSSGGRGGGGGKAGGGERAGRRAGRGRLAALRAEADQVALQRALVHRQIVMRVAGRPGRVARLEQRAQRREARYWRILLRRHPSAATLPSASPSDGRPQPRSSRGILPPSKPCRPSTTNFPVCGAGGS